MKWIFDIETDGLLPNLRTIHCIALVEVDTEETQVFGPDDLKQGLNILESAQQIIGHNIMEFDIPAIRSLYPKFSPCGQVWDTLIMSRLLWPERDSHSLESWGRTFKKRKLTRPDFSKGFSDELIRYVKRDIELTKDLFSLIQRTESSCQAIDLEHNIQDVCLRQTQVGIPFNEKLAVKLYSELSGLRHSLEETLKNNFGSWWKSNGIKVPKVSNKSKGITRGCEYEKIERVDFNPRSRDHISFCLQNRYGWVPKLFTPKGKPRVDEEVMEHLEYSEAKILKEYLMIQKRVAQLAEGPQAWLKCVGKDGRIHGKIRTQGAVTGRATHNHPNLAQVPSVRVTYGKECRSLFSSPYHQKYVGADLSGLELRCLAHYLGRFDKGEYGRRILDSDIHLINQEAAGLETRDQAKTFIYGFLYGAGNYKIGQIVGKGVKAGARLRKQFLRQVPALAQLKELVEAKAKLGYIIGIDGRRIPVRHQHAALNTLLQSAGAIICKKWVCLIDKMADEELIHGAQVLWIHDEVQWIVNDGGMEDKLGDICVRAAKKVGEQLKLRCPLDAEYKIGDTWAETH